MKLVLVIFVFLIGFTPILTAVAQNSEIPSNLVPQLPGPDQPDQELIITEQNLGLFQDLLLAPLAAWIKERKISIRAYKNLSFPWVYTKHWIEESSVSSGNYDLDANRSLAYQGQGVLSGGFPFGSAKEVNRTVDARERAYKILWNSSYASGVSSKTVYGFDLAWIGTQDFLRSATGAYYLDTQFMPGEAALKKLEEKKQEQAESSDSSLSSQASSEPQVEAPSIAGFSKEGDVFQNSLLQLFSPPVVSGFTQVNIRSRGPYEDLLWIFSPVTGRTRNLLESNRADPLLGSILAPDDIFVFSGRIPPVAARVLAEKELFVGFVSLGTTALSYGDVGHLPMSSLRAPNADSSQTETPTVEKAFQAVGTNLGPEGSLPTFVSWNYQTKKFPGRAPWMPTSAVFVPRKVWILEVSSEDPYYLSGRQIVIVDQESMLPVYKIVYNRRGTYKKTVIGLWGLVSSEDGRMRAPYCGAVLTVDADASQPIALTSQFIALFENRDTQTTKKFSTIMDKVKTLSASPAK